MRTVGYSDPKMMWAVVASQSRTPFSMAYRWVANSEDEMAKCFTNELNTNERIPNPPKGDAIVS